MAPRFVSIPSEKAELISVAGQGGVELNLYRLHGSRAGGPVVLWGHCGGFAAGSYLPLLEQLAADAEVFAFDARGHGGSQAPPPDMPVRDGLAAPIYHPDRFALDVAAIAETVAARTSRPIHYVAHSLNAVALLRLGCRFPDRFAALPFRNLLLFEPALFPSADTPVYAEAVEKNAALVARTRVRRRSWDSVQEYADYLRRRRPFIDFAPSMLAAHARATVRPTGEGSVELACRPDVEATMFAIFATDLPNSTFRLLPQFPTTPPLRLISGDPDIGESRDWVTAAIGFAAQRLRNVSFEIWRERGHMMVFEAPDRTLSNVREQIGAS
jgi:pimeloyl-ACP methyl ester carboxylesterase